MTVEVAQRRTRKPKVRAASESLAIGEIDQTVFACPACARPLALGAHQCPGCGTHLILGVQAKRASIFVTAGLVGGVVLAGIVGATASAIDRSFQEANAAVAAAAATASPEPSTSPSDTPTSSPVATVDPGTDSSVPALSRSALAQAAAVDERLTASAQALATALAAPKFDTYGVSQLLRATSAEAVLGLELSSHIGAWSGGKALSAELTIFYTTVQQTAAGGLSASIRNERAYRLAGHEMLELLHGVAALDGHVHDVAAEAGVSLATAEATR